MVKSTFGEDDCVSGVHVCVYMHCAISYMCGMYKKQTCIINRLNILRFIGSRAVHT